VIHESLGRPVPVELTATPVVQRRVKRLAAVSVVALGLIWALAERSLLAPAPVDDVLAAGWLLMPLVLAWSLAVPAARYLVVVPASLVTLGLLAVCAGWLPASPVGATGWVLMTVGVLLGGSLGLWLWFRVLPVPASLDDPGARGRWALIGVHVGLVVGGWLLAAAVGALGTG
jgi:hypothetical protein